MTAKPIEATPEQFPEVNQKTIKRRKPGPSLYVTLSDAHYKKLEATADGRPINVWLSRLIERNFDTLVP